MLKKAYGYLEKVTPLRSDCGRLCGGACCEGDGEIWLLPGEEELFRDLDGFEIKSDEDEYNLICKTSCRENRKIRPFGCRIFPYFPIVEEKDGRVHIRLVLDPRGSMCPLVKGEVKCERDFERAVRHAVRLLVQDKKYMDFFVSYGSLIEEIADFKEKILNK